MVKDSDNIDPVIQEDETTQESENLQSTSEGVEDKVEEGVEESDKGSDNPDSQEIEDQKAEEEDSFDLLEDSDEDEDDEEDDDLDENSVEDDGTQLSDIADIVGNLKRVLSLDKPQRKDIEVYKKQFYRSLRNEIENQKRIFFADGGEEIDFVANEPEIYTEGKEVLQQLKEKRTQIRNEEEKQKAQNAVHKKVIIEKIKKLSETQGEEDFNKTYQKFKALQTEWNSIKLVPQNVQNKLWREYQLYVEKFYDLVRINNEFREYDFKKNMEMKVGLCEVAERLDEEPDIVSAFHQLQNLHRQWREIGPVARKDREDIWNRFKAASTIINKKHQEHFEKLRANENENLELKTALCEQLESIDLQDLTTHRAWNSMSKKVQSIQAEWRTIGFVPKKWNNKIYRRYRAACDHFYGARREFFSSKRKEYEENLKKKTSLCERAEAMKDSTDWEETTPKMIEIQREWKTVGHVPYKQSNAVWKRFSDACDHFFEQKRLHTSPRYREQVENLEAKNSITEKIKNIDPAIEKEEAVKLLQSLVREWNSIGFVPKKQKEEAYKNFHTVVEEQYNRLGVDEKNRKYNEGDSNATTSIYRTREKLMRRYEKIKTDLQTYENNIGFLSVSSKKGNSLLDSMNEKVADFKEELEEIIEQIENLS